MKAFLVVNPAAGKRLRRRMLEEATTALRERGVGIELGLTRYPGHGSVLARRAAEAGFDLVVACGGDGTVGEVANGLAHSPVPMGVLPLGTVNIWATEAGIPKDPYGAAATLVVGESRAVDLGQALWSGGEDSRHFLLMAGVGLDGAVAQNLSLPMKRVLGRGAYILAAAWTAAAFRGTRVEIRVDGEAIEREIVWMVVGNTRLYGGLLGITPHARVDDGLLDLCIFSGRGLPSSLGYLVAVAGSRHLSLDGVEYRRCQEVSLWSKSPLPVQADGDPLGTTPMTFRVAPGALRVILPPGRVGGIFSASQRPVAEHTAK